QPRGDGPVPREPALRAQRGGVPEAPPGRGRRVRRQPRGRRRRGRVRRPRGQARPPPRRGAPRDARRLRRSPMNETLRAGLYVFVRAAFLGYQVISRVPPLLHTPLMSATNAISGISLIGSLVTAGAHYNVVSTILGVVAVTAATINVV